MARRQKSPGIALSSLQEAIQTLPIKQAIAASDRRSISRARSLFDKLRGFKASQIAGNLGISTQKYVALRRKAEAGEVSSATLNDLLEQTRESLSDVIASYPHSEQGQYTNDNGDNFEIDFVMTSDTFVKDKMKWATQLKHFASLRSALNYYGGATGGKEYFWIVQDNGGGYSMIDVRTSGEKKRKGKVAGETKAAKVLNEFEPLWNDTFGEKRSRKNEKPAKRKTKPARKGKGPGQKKPHRGRRK